MQAKRYFNTSGPNIPTEHYTLPRTELIAQGKDLVYKKRYFTIWAPRQTGKSTYFRLLATELQKEGFNVCHINFENYRSASVAVFLKRLNRKLSEDWKILFTYPSLPELFEYIDTIQKQKLILIIDEIEGVNSEYLNEFLHGIRNLYHSREQHSLYSVILVGVSNITGIIQDNASPFNIADELDIPYFTNAETKELLAQHESETGQYFDDIVKNKISSITANQPGLVNGFARQLVTWNENKDRITYDDYLQVEDWYLTEAIDKNIANVINKASKHKQFVEKLLFSENKIPYSIGKKEIKELHTSGLIKKGEDGTVEFWVPLYQKKLYDEFYPYTNGEGKRIAQNMLPQSYLTNENKIDFDKLLDSYKKHIQLRSFRPFREKDENGNFLSIPEAAMIYSFETFISIFLQEIEGKVYREAYISLGNTDMIINVKGQEYFIEVKKFYSPSRFEKGKAQLAYYCKQAGLGSGVYIVFVEDSVTVESVKESTQTIDGIEIKTYTIRYNEEKDFT